MVLLPAAFEKRMKLLLGNEWNDYTEALTHPTPVSIRINKNKIKGVPDLESVAWEDSGYYLPSRPEFFADPLWHAGAYYVQEASSMLVAQAVAQLIGNKKAIVLDLCAAPGGKTTLLLSKLAYGSLVVANETIKSRASVLTENVIRWGNPNVVVTQNDPEDVAKAGALFDFILVDAPCSGEGLFRKDNGATKEWSQEAVLLCAERQKRILKSAVSNLKPGGFLVYTTCTHSTEENEDIADFVEKELYLQYIGLQMEESWGLCQLSGRKGFRAYPHKTKGEGFFLAVFKKSDGKATEERQAKTIPKLKLPEWKEVENWLCKDCELVPEKNGDTLYALPEEHYSTIKHLQSVLNCKYAGCAIAEGKPGGMKPHHALALNNFVRAAHLPTLETDSQTAMAFLRKDSIPASNSTSKDWVLVMHSGVALGWGKNLGNRINNYFPKEWRLLRQNAVYSSVLTKAF